MKKYILFVFLIFAIPLAHAKRGTLAPVQLAPAESTPWFTGPLLAVSSHITAGGHFNIEPYNYLFDYNANYDSNWKRIKKESFWTDGIEFYNTIGINDWMDFAINPLIIHNSFRDQKAWHFSDLITGFGWQILMDKPDNYLPALKFSIREIFPIGRYDHLNPKKFGTDIGGAGSFQTVFVLCTSRLFHIYNAQWLNVRLAYTHYLPARVHVKGLNIFGGAKDTNAFVNPGQTDELDFAAEYSLTQNWALSCDFVFGFVQSTFFNGNPGTTPKGSPLTLEQPSETYIQLAPAFEYNFSENIGIITGAWFSVAGRNSRAFANWTSAINFYF